MTSASASSRLRPVIPGSPVMSATTLLAAGWARHQIDDALRRRKIISVAPAYYVDRELWRHATPARRHALRAEAQQMRLPGSAISHLSAAVWRGLPVPEDFDEERPADLTLLGPRGITRRSGVRLHARAHGRVDLTEERGVRLTSVAGMVVECLLTSTADASVAIADAALHQGLTTAAEILTAAAARTRTPGASAMRRRLDLVDGARESPLESMAAVRLDRPDRPRPRWQVEVYDGGVFIARVDAAWRRWGVVLELDGRVKYRRDGTGRTLWQEKRREDRLRALGLHVVRCGREDLDDPGRVWAVIDERRTRPTTCGPGLRWVPSSPRRPIDRERLPPADERAIDPRA